MSADSDHGRGKIQDNAVAALVTSKLYRPKQERSKKGKGSFKRKAKHKGRENRPYYLEAETKKCALAVMLIQVIPIHKTAASC